MFPETSLPSRVSQTQLFGEEQVAEPMVRMVTPPLTAISHILTNVA
jgi:hypothetical protein